MASLKLITKTEFVNKAIGLLAEKLAAATYDLYYSNISIDDKVIDVLTDEEIEKAKHAMMSQADDWIVTIHDVTKLIMNTVLHTGMMDEETFDNYVEHMSESDAAFHLIEGLFGLVTTMGTTIHDMHGILDQFFVDQNRMDEFNTEMQTEYDRQIGRDPDNYGAE